MDIAQATPYLADPGAARGRTVWLWGATGEAGRRLGPLLAHAGVPLVLLGRSADRLAALRDVDRAETRVMTEEQLVPELRRAAAEQRGPAVLVNTVGPFDERAEALIDACVELGIDHVDVSNEEASVARVLARDDAARDRGVRLVTAAGYGVAATECLVLALAEGRAPARSVTVAALPHLETLGPAVTRSALAALGSGGRRYAGGDLIETRIGRPAIGVPLPDGATIRAAAAPTGDLHAAHRASGAQDVLALSGEVPAGRLAQAAMPVLTALFARRRIRDRLLALLDRGRVTAPVGRHLAVAGHPRDASWSWARLEWDDGRSRTGWLRLGPSYAFTAAVLGEVTHRLLAGDVAPGAYTPGALGGHALATALGGELILDEEHAA